jgi:hypothetical protein
VDATGLIFEFGRKERQGHSVTALFASLVEVLDHNLFIVTSNHLSRLVLVKVNNVLLAYYADSSPVPPVINLFVRGRRFSQNKNDLLEFLGLALATDGEGLVFLRTEGLSNGVVFEGLLVLDVRERFLGAFLKLDGLSLLLNNLSLSVNLVALDFSVFLLQLHKLS